MTLKVKRNLATKILALALVVVAAALSWRGATPAHARTSSGDKVSADLKQKLNGGGKVDVVINAAGFWSTTLDNAVKNSNGSVTKSYANFPVRAVSLPASAVAALASYGTIEAGGTMMTDSTLMNDGVLMADGVLIGDGVVITDGVIMGDVCVQASKAMIYGDNTTSMADVVEASLPPNAPSALTAAATSKSQINLSWSDNSTDESGFEVERSTDGQVYTQLTTVAAGVKTYASTGLTACKKYYFRVRAYNANGNSAYTSAATATTPTK